MNTSSAYPQTIQLLFFLVAIDLQFNLTKFQSAFLGLLESAISPVLLEFIVTLGSVSMRLKGSTDISPVILLKY